MPGIKDVIYEGESVDDYLQLVQTERKRVELMGFNKIDPKKYIPKLVDALATWLMKK